MVQHMSVHGSFILLNNITLCGYTTFYLLILSAGGHLHCFHFLAIMNNTVINIYVQVLCRYVFYSVKVKLLGHMVTF